jgi:hypothetical protein
MRIGNRGAGRRRAPLLLMALACAATPAPAAAQETRIQPGSLLLAVFGGGLAFGDFQQGVVQASWADGAGLPAQQSMNGRVSAASAAVVGAAAAYWITSRVGVRAQASYAPTRYVVREREGATRPEWGSAAPLAIWIADAAVMLRLPWSPGVVEPYAIAGAAAARYAAQLPEAGEDARLRPGAVLGAGARVPLRGSRLGLAFELTDHITGTPLRAGHTAELQRSGGLLLRLEGGSEPSTGGDVRFTHNVHLTIGAALLVGSHGRN